MPYTIAYNLTEFAPDLYLPSAYIVALDDAKILSYRQKKATEDNLSEYQLVYTPTVKKLFDIIGLLAPKNLEKKYNVNPKKPLTLANLLADKTISNKITEFIYRHIGEFLQTIMQEQFPLCLDIEGKVIAHLTQITLNSTLLQPKIYFEQTPEGLNYRLQIKENNTTWFVQKKPILLMCNEPAYIIREAQLYRIDSINSARLKPFFTKDEVNVPNKNVKDYCQKIILPLVEKIDFEHKGFDIIPHNTILKAELDVTHNFINNSSGISLVFNYGKMSFNWKDARTQRSFLEINDKEQVIIHHVKRDAEAENVFIEALKELGLSNQESNYFEPNNAQNSKANDIINWLIANEIALKKKFSVSKHP
jgi:hypothetical protein